MRRLLLALLTLSLSLPAAITSTYLQSSFSETDLTTYTFSSQSLGSAAADRYIVVAVHARGLTTGLTISSVTVGGIAASISVQEIASNQNPVGLAIAAVPTGTTGDIVITFSGAMARCAYSAYRLTGTNIALTAIASSTAGGSYGMSVNVAAGGTAIAASNQIATGTVTWTGVTEDVDASPSGFLSYSAASDDFASAQTPLATTAVFSSGLAATVIASYEETSAVTRRIYVID